MTRPTGFKAKSASAFAAPWCGALPPTFQPNRAPHHPCSPHSREWKAKGGGDPSSHPGAGKAGQHPRACGVAVEGGFGLPGAGTASCIPRHHHAAATGDCTGTTAGRRVVVFPAPACLLGCYRSILTGHNAGISRVLVRGKSDRLPRLQSNETSNGKNTSLSSLTNSFR